VLRTIYFTALCFVGCLPPPRAWPEANKANADADADADTDADSDADDTGVMAHPCSSVVFGENAHLAIQATDVVGGSLYTSSSFSFDLWAWLSVLETDEPVMMVGLGKDKAWSLGVSAGQLSFQMGPSIVAMAMPEVGWHHIAAVYDHEQSQLRMYLDGEMAADPVPVEALLSVPEDEVLHIASTGSDDLSWTNSIDEFRFALGVMHTGMSTEIADPSDTQGLAGLWSFSDLSNTLTGGEASGTGYGFVDSCP